MERKPNEEKNFFLGIVLLIIVVMGCIDEATPTETEPTETTETIIKWKEEVDIEEVETATVADPIEEVKFYNVPLDEELQLHIFAECEKFNISPAIVIAMIERESSYKANEIGDNGNSLGLMQIQPRWNEERMKQLGCTDLLDPFQNVTVGIDILAELIEENPDVYWVLMAYNGGQAYATRNINKGIYSDYAIEVVERATQFEKEID